MAEEVDYISFFEDLNTVIEKLPAMTQAYGIDFNSFLPLKHFEKSKAGVLQLNEMFKTINFDALIKENSLSKSIDSKKREIKKLESRLMTLKTLIGTDDERTEGNSFNSFVKLINIEMDQLRLTRDGLDSQIKDKETELSEKINNIGTEVKTSQEKAKEAILQAEANAKREIRLAEEDAKQKIREAEINASDKVRLINQFSDFLSETNKNMNIYYWVIFFLSIGSIATVALSIPSLLKSFNSYDVYVNGMFASRTPWQILNFAFGILIVKLPWALCLSAIFTGIYRLLRGLITTYEKINQDKRNMSAIYAVSGNIAQSLNEYGFAIADHENEDGETGESYTAIRVSNKELNQKKESLKWNQIMNYFERMQHHKEDIVEKQDESKLKLVTDLLKTTIERIPKT